MIISEGDTHTHIHTHTHTHTQTRVHTYIRLYIEQGCGYEDVMTTASRLWMQLVRVFPHTHDYKLDIRHR